MTVSTHARIGSQVTVLTVLTLAVWGGSVRNGFVFDDLANIVRNPWIKDARLLPQAFLHHAAGFDASYSTSFYRPLMHVLYAGAYGVAGARPWPFHLLNVIAHVLAVLCAYQLARHVIARWGNPIRYPSLPFAAAIVFSVHPVHTEPVLWIAGITDLSYTLFGLLALMAYLRAWERVGFALLAAALLLTSLLCKETGVVILPVLVLFEWFESRSGRAWTLQAAGTRLAPAVLAMLAYLGLRVAALGSFAPSAAQHQRGLAELAAAASALFARYLGMLVAPIRLTVMREIRLDVGFDAPLAVTGLVAAAALAAMAYRFRRAPLVVLVLAFAVLPILPVLYVPAIESGWSVFGERYLYLPVLGVGLALGLGVEELRQRFAWGRSAQVVVMCLFVAFGATTALVRTRAWSSSLSLWTDAVAKSPDSAAAHEGLCFALYAAGRVPESLDACGRALALDPARLDARTNHATALLALGRPLEAKGEFDAVLARQPDSAETLVNRGLACMMLGQVDEAMRSYRRALEIDPNYAEAHNVIGVALFRSGQRDEALGHFEQAVRLAPDNAEYRDNLRVTRRRTP